MRPHPAERWRSVGRRCGDRRALRRQAAAAAFGVARWAGLEDLLLHAAAGLDGARALRLLHEEEWADELQVTRRCVRTSRPGSTALHRKSATNASEQTRRFEVVYAWHPGCKRVSCSVQ